MTQLKRGVFGIEKSTLVTDPAACFHLLQLETAATLKGHRVLLTLPQPIMLIKPSAVNDLNTIFKSTVS